MFGLPLWIGFAAPFVAIVYLLFVLHVHRRRIDAFKAEGMRTGEAIHAAKGSWIAVLVGFVLVIFSIGLMMGASGEYDESQLDAACAKHGMHGYRIPFGRNQCIDPQTGQLRAFEDVR